MSKEQIRDENKLRVIKAAQELFISDGVANTSINRIASEVGLSPMSIYRYFGNKVNLVLAAWRDALSVFYEGYMQRYNERAKGLKNGYERCVAAMEEYSIITPICCFPSGTDTPAKCSATPQRRRAAE